MQAGNVTTSYHQLFTVPQIINAKAQSKRESVTVLYVGFFIGWKVW